MLMIHHDGVRYRLFRDRCGDETSNEIVGWLLKSVEFNGVCPAIPHNVKMLYNFLSSEMYHASGSDTPPHGRLTQAHAHLVQYDSDIGGHDYLMVHALLQTALTSCGYANSEIPIVNNIKNKLLCDGDFESFIMNANDGPEMIELNFLQRESDNFTQAVVVHTMTLRSAVEWALQGCNKRRPIIYTLAYNQYQYHSQKVLKQFLEVNATYDDRFQSLSIAFDEILVFIDIFVSEVELQLKYQFDNDLASGTFGDTFIDRFYDDDRPERDIDNERSNAFILSVGRHFADKSHQSHAVDHSVLLRCNPHHPGERWQTLPVNGNSIQANPARWSVLDGNYGIFLPFHDWFILFTHKGLARLYINYIVAVFFPDSYNNGPL